MLLSHENQTKSKNVIQCPVCQEKGIRQNLAVVNDNKITVMRFEKQEINGLKKEYTIIESDHFKIYCGLCGSLVLNHE